MHYFLKDVSIHTMTEPGGDEPKKPIILPTDATILDPRMALESTHQRPNLRPSQELLDITSRRKIIALDTRQKQTQEFPLLSDKQNAIYKTTGQIAILEHAVYGPDGLMSIAEAVNEGTDDLSDQARTNLYVGASREMTGWVLGYADSADTNAEDDALWKDRYLTEEKYFHELYEARKKIPNKKFVKYEGETMHMTLFLEFAESMKPKELEIYMSREADERARYNLGIAEQEIPDQDFFNEWVKKEKAYIEDALQKHKASHGRKDFTILY